MKLGQLIETRGFPLVEAAKKSFSEEQLKWLNAYVENFKLIDHAFSVRGKKINSVSNFFFIHQYEQDYEALPECIRFGSVKSFILTDSTTLTNCALLPEKAESIDFYKGSTMPSFKDIFKTVKFCRVFCLNGSFKDGLLALFQINGVEKVNLTFDVQNSKTKKSKELIRAAKIVNRHLADNDVFACQDDLEEAGLGKYC